jgi:hypothetical protein
MSGMIGTEPPDREPAENTGPESRDDHLVYRDRLGAVSEARPMSRPGLIAAVVAVCGTGLLAGLGLFGGTTPRPRPAAPVPVVMKAADTMGARTGDQVRERPARRLHPHHLPKHVPHSWHAVHENGRWTHKGSAGSGAPHGAGRHSPVRERIKPSARPATERPAASSGTPRTAPRPTSAATGPAASR